MDKRFLGKQIQKYRENTGLSQEAFAEKLGLSAIHISYIERGVRVPSVNVLINIANLLDVSTDVLLGPQLKSNAFAQSALIEQKLQTLPPAKRQKLLAFFDAIIDIENNFDGVHG